MRRSDTRFIYPEKDVSFNFVQNHEGTAFEFAFSWGGLYHASATKVRQGKT
jgi:hypothetical protein